MLFVSHYVLALDSGPEDSPFEGGVFVAELVFPLDYPLSPPKMKFTSEMFHPNGPELHTVVGKKLMCSCRKGRCGHERGIMFV